jgi:hypothetical protein
MTPYLKRVRGSCAFMGGDYVTLEGKTDGKAVITGADLATPLLRQRLVLNQPLGYSFQFVKKKIVCVIG